MKQNRSARVGQTPDRTKEAPVTHATDPSTGYALFLAALFVCQSAVGWLFRHYRKETDRD